MNRIIAIFKNIKFKFCFSRKFRFLPFSECSPYVFIVLLLISINSPRAQGSQLFDYVNSGRTEGVIEVLKNGGNPNEIDSDGKSILLCAHENFLKYKKKEYEKIYILLVQYGANVNIRTSNSLRNNSGHKKTLLHELTEWGQIDLAKLLLDKGANAMEKIENNTLIHVAAEKSGQDFLQIYLERALSPDEKGENGESPLYFAIRGGKSDNVKFLLEKGANPNLVNWSGDVPLTFAVSRVDLNLVQILLKYGAKTNHLNDMGNSVLFTAAGIESTYNKKMIPIINLLIQSGLNINSQNIYGSTVLSYSLAARNLGLLSYFLNKGANPNVRDNLGNTLLHKIVLHSLYDRLKNKELEDFFAKIFDFGGDVSIKNNENQTPLHLALKPFKDRDENASLQCVRILVDRSADPMQEDRLGANAFDYANSESKKLLNANIQSLGLEVLYKDSNFKFISLGASEKYLFLVGELDKKIILTRFTLEGKPDKQVILENASDMAVIRDGIYIAGITKNTIERSCNEKIYIQKLNFSLQEEWKNFPEGTLPCEETGNISLPNNSDDLVFIQYSINGNRKFYLLNRDNGSRDKEILTSEEIYSINKSKDRIILVGKSGVYSFSFDYSPREKKYWKQKKQLMVAYSTDSVYTVQPYSGKQGFSLTKMDAEYSGIWKRNYSSSEIDNPIFLKILADNVLIAGETRGGLHGNRNITKQKNIFVQNTNSSGYRLFTYQGVEEESLLGFTVSIRGDIYLCGQNSSSIWVGRLHVLPIPKK